MPEIKEIRNTKVSKAVSNLIFDKACEIGRREQISPFVILNSACINPVVSDSRFEVMQFVKDYIMFCRSHRWYVLKPEISCFAKDYKFRSITIMALCRLFGTNHSSYIRMRNKRKAG